MSHPSCLNDVYAQALLVLPAEPVPSPLQDNVCKRLKKLSVHDYLVLGNHLLKDHFKYVINYLLNKLVCYSAYVSL